MSSQYQLKIAPEKAKEMPMVDLAFVLLKSANTPFYYRDLMQEIAKLKGFTDDDVMRVIAQLYTEINVDGRFACVGNNLWGLKRWYPIETKSEEGGGNAKRPRIINDDDDDLDEEDVFVEEEETYAAEEDEFDAFHVDRDEVGIEAEDEEEEDLFGEELEADGDEDAIDDADGADDEDSEESDDFDLDEIEDEEESK